MRISDWSSDVCSSDLLAGREEVGRHPDDVDHLGRRSVGEGGAGEPREDVVLRRAPAVLHVGGELLVEVLERRLGQVVVTGAADAAGAVLQQIGRASCRERVWQYV